MAVIFFDIDGTLATGTEVPVSAEAAIARTRERGNLVFICTGRPVWYAREHFGYLADGFVCCNGRLATLGDKALVARGIPDDLVGDICAILDGEDAGYAFFGLERPYYGGNAAYEEVASSVHGTCSPLFEADEGLFGFDVYFEDASARSRIEDALDSLCLVNPHGPHPSADVTLLDFGKGDAVREVVRALGLSIDDAYAFGDGVNDISMVLSVAHGVAMGNACDKLKAVAAYVTSDIDDDGVARGLEHFGLA